MNHTALPTNIPVTVLASAARMLAKLKRELPWWWKAELPTSGIPVSFVATGCYRAGVSGWIIEGFERTVFLGEASERSIVAEFVVLLPGGTQVLAQCGRDFRFANTEAALAA